MVPATFERANISKYISQLIQVQVYDEWINSWRQDNVRGEYAGVKFCFEFALLRE